MKRSKKYTEVAKKVKKGEIYKLDEGLALARDVVYSKFDNSFDAIITLSLKDKQKKESVKGTVTFPNKLGAEVRVAVLAEGADADAAKAAGAKHAGGDSLIKEIENGLLDFDIVIATPSIMAKAAKLGRYIGKQGLMPNPKNGTVTTDVEKAVKSFLAGKTNFKMQEGGVFQIKFAKSSMSTEQIKENFLTLFKSIYREIKKFGDDSIKSIIVSPTMGPNIKIDFNSFKDEVNK